MHQPFNDHFAPVAGRYADFRPTYPHQLFTWLAGLVPQRALAWDCAAGSGQASVDLAAVFERVVATDASQAQIDAAIPHSRIDYRVAPAEASGLPDRSVDLITVAQALHWFDLAGFYAEVRRVLRPGGVLAVWTYGVLSVEGAEVDALVQRFYYDTVGPYWPVERTHVEDGYRSLPFPFSEIAAPDFTMAASRTLFELLEYIRSWSATHRFMVANGTDPVITLEQQLAPLWGAPERRRQLVWPLSLRVGRVE
jgi:ubiquinone/menaquinone biosynthesis C-methylase UbiE